MSDYCELQVLTNNNLSPDFIELTDYFYNMSSKVNDNLMFDLTVIELSLCDIIGKLRNLQNRLGCKIYIKYAAYMGTDIYDTWLDDLKVLPYLKPWQMYAIHLKKATFIQYQLEQLNARLID